MRWPLSRAGSLGSRSGMGAGQSVVLAIRLQAVKLRLANPGFLRSSTTFSGSPAST